MVNKNITSLLRRKKQYINVVVTSFERPALTVFVCHAIAYSNWVLSIFLFLCWSYLTELTPDQIRDMTRNMEADLKAIFKGKVLYYLFCNCFPDGQPG